MGASILEGSLPKPSLPGISYLDWSPDPENVHPNSFVFVNNRSK